MNVGDDYLQHLEVLAVEVDALEATAVAFEIPYSNAACTAAVTVKRDRLLNELDVVGILTGEHEARLRTLELANLSAYADAAAALRHYYATPDYARYVKKPVPARVIDGAISLDWFRRPSGFLPSKFNAFEWLALCDWVFQDSRSPLFATTWTKIGGAGVALSCRSELAAARLYRAAQG